MLKILNLRILLVLISLFSASWAAADCGLSGLQISGATPLEQQTSCDSLTQVVSLFKTVGVEINPKFKLFFEDQAIVLFGEELVEVHGYFDDEKFEMHITTFANPRNKELTPFGLPWELKNGVSYVLHEMTHLVVATDLALHQRKLKHEWHEFMAYAVQLELMDLELRNNILNQYSKTEAFENPEAVNSMIYEMDPDVYAVKAYKSMKVWGGVSFLKKVLAGEVPIALRVEGQK